jgi:hypothetical protein
MKISWYYPFNELINIATTVLLEVVFRTKIYFALLKSYLFLNRPTKTDEYVHSKKFLGDW